MKTSQRVSIHGHVSAGFEAVRDAFAGNFSRRHEGGGACCVYYRGDKVVDLWGGVRNKSTGEPWEEDTMVLVWSATRGLSAMTLALAHSRPIRLAIASLNRRSNIHRALIANPGAAIARDEQRIYARDLEVPSGGGVGTARAIARAYGVFATDGRELKLRPATLQALAAPPIPATHGFYDECLFGDVRFSLGFMKPGPILRFGSEASFGSPGTGGSFGFADPVAGIGYAYVTSRMGATLTGDARDLALRDALYSVIPRADVPAAA